MNTKNALDAEIDKLVDSYPGISQQCRDEQRAILKAAAIFCCVGEPGKESIESFLSRLDAALFGDGTTKHYPCPPSHDGSHGPHRRQHSPAG